MERYVYIVRNHGSLIQGLLEEKGFTVHVGDGTIDVSELEKCEVLMPGGKVTVGKDVLDQAPHLRLVAKSGVGYDRIDVGECTLRGIYVANTPMTNYISVAEHVLMLMLACARRVYAISTYLRHEYPDFWCRERYEGTELYGKTLSIIGLGNIGRRVAALARGFDMEIAGFDPFADKMQLPEYIHVCGSVEEALSMGDFITLHVAGSPSTHHMIGEKQLNIMKKTAILINAARGSVIDEEALVRALRDRQIAGAGLDCFENEPIKPGNPLMFMENVVATPHCAGNTDAARIRTQYDCAANIFDIYEGRQPRFALNQISM